MYAKAKKAIRHALSYLRARLGGKALLSRQLGRLLACNECPRRIEVEGRAYCGACGCPTSKWWKSSVLENKVKYLKATCPLDKWQK